MRLKHMTAAVLSAAMLLAPAAMMPQPAADTFAVTAAAEDLSSMPQEYRTACDWIWANRIETEKSCEAWSTIYDQIVAGNGTLQYILIWQSYEPITLEQRRKLPEMLETAVNRWTDHLVGYDDWPFTHVNVEIVGYAVLDESCLLDLQPDEVVYTDTANSWLRDDMISSGMGDVSIPAIQPAEPTDLSRYAHWNDRNWNYGGSYDNRYDMYLHGITGMINMGGYGYHYGQILSDQSILGLVNGTTSEHILLHEMGHGFGFPDYYGGEGESDGFPPGGFPGGENSIMMAGSCGYINTFDQWFLKYTWSKLKAEEGRFDLANVQPAPTETPSDIPYLPSTGVTGYVDANGVFDLRDLVLVQKWLLGTQNVHLSDWKAGDLYEDEILDVYDLSLLKRLLLSPAQAEPGETSGDLIASTVANFGKLTPSVGDCKMLSIFVEFADTKYSRALPAETLQQELFGSGNGDYPYDSISDWYERASYGNLHVDGDVYYYTLPGNMADYMNNDRVFEDFVMSVLTGLDAQIDYSRYDANNDGVIDCISLGVPLDNADETLKEYWWGCTGTWYANPDFAPDGKHLNKFIIMDSAPYADTLHDLKSVMTHEMGHSLGLPDYYYYDAGDDWEGFLGAGGTERMDDSIGDFSSFSKLMYGWLRENEVQWYSGGEQTFQLQDVSEQGSCLIVPISSGVGDLTAEYFLVEYVTAKNNNTDIAWYYPDDNAGVRIFHIKSDLFTDDWGSTTFMYEAYSPAYQGNDRFRVIRRVNDGQGFYHSGDICTYGTPGFAAYDAQGYQTVDTGLTIRIGELRDGAYTVTVSK